MVFQKVGPNPSPDAPERGDIRDQSSKSRHRAAFAFGNAECSWACMILLTWHYAPSAPDVKGAIKKLRRLWRERWGESMDAWLMEMHASGVPHFHVFAAAESAFGAACMSSERRTVRRKKHTVELIGGAPERWLIGAWLACTGQLGDAAALSFNRGGIIEVLRSADAAGRYVAKECSKREQKVLPDIYAEGLGRWWWLNSRWAPIVRETYQVSLAKWPFENPMSHVWKADDVAMLDKLAPHAPAGSRLYHIRENRGFNGAPLKLPGGQILMPFAEKKLLAPIFRDFWKPRGCRKIEKIAHG